MIYETIVSVIGYLPSEFEFIYAVITFIASIFMLCIACIPLIMLYEFIMNIRTRRRI